MQTDEKHRRPAIDPALTRAYPNLARFFEPVASKNPLQAKALNGYLTSRDAIYRARAEAFAGNMIALLKSQNIEIDYVVDCYLKMCWNMLAEQTRFKKTGKYSCENQAQALVDVYLSEQEMTSYMYGLALSQFLWPNHYGMYDFFVSRTEKLRPPTSYLEIGPGHGLYLAAAMEMFPDCRFRAIDISPTSLDITRKTVAQITGRSDCEFDNYGLAEVKDDRYDFVVMCEVLEHLDDPAAALEKIRGLMNEGGRAFITTCANCPAIDHVYLYRSVADIRDQLRAANFEIVEDIALPVGNHDEGVWEESAIEVNYAALLKNRGSR